MSHLNLSTQEDDRWQEIRTLHREYRVFYEVLGGFVLLGFGVILGTSIFHNEAGYPVNIYTEALSLVITVFVLGRFARAEANRQLRRNNTISLYMEWMGAPMIEARQSYRAAEKLLSHWRSTGIVYSINEMYEEHLEKRGFVELADGTKLSHEEISKFWTVYAYFRKTGELFDMGLLDTILLIQLMRVDIAYWYLFFEPLTHAEIVKDKEYPGIEKYKCIFTLASAVGVEGLWEIGTEGVKRVGSKKKY